MKPFIGPRAVPGVEEREPGVWVQASVVPCAESPVPVLERLSARKVWMETADVNGPTIPPIGGSQVRVTGEN